MKELDVLLERFLASEIEMLTAGETEMLERLLDADDQDLLAWLTGAAAPADEVLSRAVERIRRGLGVQAE